MDIASSGSVEGKLVSNGCGTGLEIVVCGRGLGVRHSGDAKVTEDVG